MAVVAFHAGVGFLPGGFVGVDVFYVISGFLITDLLWRELEGNGKVRLAAFYARRARRLLPAAMLVLVVTVAWAAAVMPPLELRSVWKDGLYCALYAGNFRFAATGTDYLADRTPSPFQHYWSLGVEEQFYLLWPLLLIGFSLVAWRRRPSRGAAGAALSLLTAASLALSVAVTRHDQPLAFFLLPTRAWELSVGALLSLCAPFVARHVPVGLARVAGWAGLAAVMVACITFGPGTAFPGYAAVLPVAGAAAVIGAGLVPSPGGAGRVLQVPVMTGIGRLSYSWYLWHFPPLVLVPLQVGHPLAEPLLWLLGAGTIIPAALTYRFVETPLRLARPLVADARRSLAAGLAFSATGIAACAGAALSIPPLGGKGEAPVASVKVPVTTSPTPGAVAPAPPQLSVLVALEQQVEAAVEASAGTKDVPANLDPSLTAASGSIAAPMDDGCLDGYTSYAVSPGCRFGDVGASRSIVLFGDSHAAMWFPAVDSWANAHGYALLVWTKAACPPVGVPMFSPVLGRDWTECSRWYASAMAALAATRPALVVLGIAPNYDAAYRVTQNGPAWLAALSNTVSQLRRSGDGVLVLGSLPSPPFSIPECLSGALENVPACGFSPVGRRVSGGGLVGVDQAGDDAEAATARAAGATYLDVVPLFCTASVCDPVVDNLLVYRDNSHITVPYAQYLAPVIGAAMDLALGRAGT